MRADEKSEWQHVRLAAVKEFFEVYGPVYVPARGMRLLYGSGTALVP